MDAFGLRRRRHVRGNLHGVASLIAHGERHLGPFLIENLSAGGALLKGSPVPTVGATVEVHLHLPGLAPIHVPGVILRSHEGAAEEASFAVSFRDVPQHVEAAIHGCVRKAMEQSRDRDKPAVLVVDASPVERFTIARELESLGCQAVIAATIQDALQRLEDPREPTDVVLVDLGSRPIGGVALLAFLRGEFPEVRRVLLAREADSGDAHAALSDAIADALLFEPWDRQHLASAIGLVR